MKNNKEQFDFYVKNGLIPQKRDIERVTALARMLLDSLFEPVLKDCLYVPDKARIKKMGIDIGEPINWGSLSATVCKKEGLYIVTIEEASPGDCPTLCEFVTKYLTVWGWPVMVQTEW